MKYFPIIAIALTGCAYLNNDQIAARQRESASRVKEADREEVKDCSIWEDDDRNPFIIFQIDPEKKNCQTLGLSDLNQNPDAEYRTLVSPRIIVTKDDLSPSFQIYIESRRLQWAFFDHASFQYHGKAAPMRALGQIDRSVQVYRPLEEVYFLKLSNKEFQEFTQSDMKLRLYGRDANEDFDIDHIRFKNIWDDYQNWRSKQK